MFVYAIYAESFHNTSGFLIPISNLTEYMSCGVKLFNRKYLTRSICIIIIWVKNKKNELHREI